VQGKGKNPPGAFVYDSPQRGKEGRALHSVGIGKGETVYGRRKGFFWMREGRQQTT